MGEKSVDNWRLTWYNCETQYTYNLTGSKKAIEQVLEAVTFFEGNKDIKVEKI